MTGPDSRRTGQASDLSSDTPVSSQNTEGLSELETVEAFFDRELDAEGQRRLFAALDRDESARRRFAENETVIEDLRRPVRSPDLSGAILEEVRARRGWLAPKLQRFVTAGRLAAAACLLATAGALFTAKRLAPENPVFNPDPAPVSNVVESSQAEAAEGVQRVLGAFDRLRRVGGERSFAPPRNEPLRAVSVNPNMPQVIVIGADRRPQQQALKINEAAFTGDGAQPRQDRHAKVRAWIRVTMNAREDRPDRDRRVGLVRIAERGGSSGNDGANTTPVGGW